MSPIYRSSELFTRRLTRHKRNWYKMAYIYCGSLKGNGDHSRYMIKDKTARRHYPR
ncbi:hypothetical protein M404DRAFT_1004887 [Pisolithus tinctorius Marx 270]|uniref:Uncharacterized protein n=1 Tax=Pisolithus tinctorius Marx 270 TaxID=870435 RepID=A0A0C3NVF4_PISTI|nr:hypothetical protein M404DRAFT_1004887 [Pisolithus tinctorius Marx 270]